MYLVLRRDCSLLWLENCLRHSFPRNLTQDSSVERWALKAGKKNPVQGWRMALRGPLLWGWVCYKGSSAFSCPHTPAHCVMSSIPLWYRKAGLLRCSISHLQTPQPRLRYSFIASQNSGRHSLSPELEWHFFPPRTTTCCWLVFQLRHSKRLLKK